MDLLGIYSLTSLSSLPFVLALPIALFVLRGFALMRISKKLGVDGGWMAFVPLANGYLMGKVAEQDSKRNSPQKKGVKWAATVLWLHLTLGFFALAATVIISILAVYTVNSGTEGDTVSLVAGSFGIVLLWVLAYLLFFVLGIAIMVVLWIVLYKIYHVMAGKHAIWMLLLSMVIGMASTVMLLVLAYSKKFSGGFDVSDVPVEPAEQREFDVLPEEGIPIEEYPETKER